MSTETHGKLRLKVGSKFRWRTRKHHVLGFVEDKGKQLIVSKYWRGRSWGFEVIPVWLFFAMRASNRNLNRKNQHEHTL